MNQVVTTTAGTLVISLDLELHWGVCDKRPISKCRSNFDGVYEVVPQLLRAFAKCRVHATWAIVGMLFFETKEELLARLPGRRPHYANHTLSPYCELDTIGDNWHEDPYHFAPGLVRIIAESCHQEIGTHTFSHYYCLERGQNIEAFKADIKAAIDVAGQCGVTLKSIVFPRNQYSKQHLAACEALGFVAWRGNPEKWFWQPSDTGGEGVVKRGVRLVDAYLPISRHNGYVMASCPAGTLVNVRASRFLRPVVRTMTKMDSLRLSRIKMEMLSAARSGCTYHLWWHPENFGSDVSVNLEFVGRILEWFDHLRATEGMQSLSMCEVAEKACTMYGEEGEKER